MESSDSQSAGGKAKSLRRSSRLSDSRSSIVSGVIVGVIGPGSELKGEGGGEGREGDGAVTSDCRSELLSSVSVVGEGVRRSSRLSASSPSLAPSPSISLPLITSTVERRNDEAIVRAAERRELAEVTRLYEDGVSLESTDNGGWTALVRVCYCEPNEVALGEDVFHYFLSNGVKVNAVDDDGDSALYSYQL